MTSSTFPYAREPYYLLESPDLDLGLPIAVGSQCSFGSGNVLGGGGEYIPPEPSNGINVVFRLINDTLQESNRSYNAYLGEFIESSVPIINPKFTLMTQNTDIGQNESIANFALTFQIDMEGLEIEIPPYKYDPELSYQDNYNNAPFRMKVNGTLLDKDITLHQGFVSNGDIYHLVIGNNSVIRNTFWEQFNEDSLLEIEIIIEESAEEFEEIEGDFILNFDTENIRLSGPTVRTFKFNVFDMPYKLFPYMQGYRPIDGYTYFEIDNSNIGEVISSNLPPEIFVSATIKHNELFDSRVVLGEGLYRYTVREDVEVFLNISRNINNLAYSLPKYIQYKDYVLSGTPIQDNLMGKNMVYRVDWDKQPKIYVVSNKPSLSYEDVDNAPEVLSRLEDKHIMFGSIEPDNIINLLEKIHKVTCIAVPYEDTFREVTRYLTYWQSGSGTNGEVSEFEVKLDDREVGTIYYGEGINPVSYTDGYVDYYNMNFRSTMTFYVSLPDLKHNFTDTEYMWASEAAIEAGDNSTHELSDFPLDIYIGGNKISQDYWYSAYASLSYINVPNSEETISNLYISIRLVNTDVFTEVAPVELKLINPNK